MQGKPARGPASLIVVRSDGSDARVVVPEGFSERTGDNQGLGPFAWTPDGSAIVVEIDSPPHVRGHHDGELTVFDAAGVGKPRSLVPPLFANVGAIYFHPSAQIAPMFRPPAGDLILGCCRDALEVFDADLTPLRQLDFGPLAQYDIFADDPTWSPDGARILVSLGLYDGGQFLDGEVIVMDADGGDLRRLGPGDNPMWSPDSASIAYEDVGPDWDFRNPLNNVRIAVLDLASGTKRVLESSIAPVKIGAAVDTITNNEWHTWYYEGWSWSPDGRSLLLLKDHRTRPVVVDVRDRHGDRAAMGNRFIPVMAADSRAVALVDSLRQGCTGWVLG